MTLALGEQPSGGFPRAGFDTDTVEDNALVVTTDTTGAKMQSGFLRDPDGRLVVVYQ